MLVVEYLLAADWRRGLDDWRSQTRGAFSVANRRHRLLDLQWTRLARLRVDVPPVVQAKGNVAIFLNLEDHDIAAERVDRPRGCEHSVSDSWRDADKVVRQSIVRERIP